MCLLIVDRNFYFLAPPVDSEFSKKTHTNITIKKKSNHKESVKKAVIKGYADRARALCDEQHLEAEMDNIADVFKANGYEEKEIGGHEAKGEERRS